MRLAQRAARVVGIDTSGDSLELARRVAGRQPRCEFMLMDACDLQFDDDTFDAVVCVQNGICAFGVDQVVLVREALRVTRPSGVAFFSTYSDRFWPHRLAWFEAQAAEGLLGSIDYAASGDGVIACNDGFRVGRLTPEELVSLCSRIGVVADISEVDDACVFCAIKK